MSASTAGTNSTRNKHSPHNSRDYAAPDQLDITKEEFSRISDALKNEEFRKMFLDYCEEIQNPENRKRYQEEIIQLEAERGVEVKFINPEPGFVIKTSLNGELKCFVNVAKSDVVAKPSNEACLNPQTGRRGLSWAIPLAQAAPRDDLDAHGKRCRVFDVIFHPDALYLAQRNADFHKCLIATALDAVEREFKVKLDRTNLKFPKLQFKGISRPTVIRKLAAHPPAEATEPHPLDDIYPAKPTPQSAVPKVLPLQTADTMSKPEFTTPRHTIKHRRAVDLAEYTEELDAKLSVTVPRELVVEIELPLLNSTAECQLDVTPKSLYLLSERPGAKYRLQLALPYEVDDKSGSARFDTDTRRLCVTLPVVQHNACEQRNMHDTLRLLSREDSGVESEATSNSESPVEELSDSVEEAAPNQQLQRVEEHDEAETDALLSTAAVGEATAVSDPQAFLKSTIHYQFPTKHDCNVLDNGMSLVLHVRNVQPESIATLRQDSSVHLQFASIGSGYYPAHYAFYLQLPESAEQLEITAIEAEAWENNVVLNLSLSHSCEQLHTYLAGINCQQLQEYSVQEKFQVAHHSRQRKKTPPVTTGAGAALSASLEISVERSDCERSVEIEIKAREPHQPSSCAANTTEDDEDAATARADAAQQAQKKINKKQKKKNKKRRSLSESACDDLKAYQQQQQERQEAAKPAMKNLPTHNNKTEQNEDSSSPERDDQVGVCKQPSSSVAVPTGAVNGQARKQRSYSECRDSMLSGSNGSSTLPSSFKGILKRFSRYEPRPSISDSCSSIDEFSSYSCSTDANVLNSLRFSKSFSDIPEENVCVSLSESCKKTVRFNEVIKKQIFRHDSSILGQRKKNQKRRDRKQRALQRRLSEGDSADYEDNNKPVVLSTDTQYFKLIDSNNTNNKSNNSNSANMKSIEHDSGLDLSHVATMDIASVDKKSNTKSNKMRPRLESESSSDVEASKNVMMFEMDM